LKPQQSVESLFLRTNPIAPIVVEILLLFSTYEKAKDCNGKRDQAPKLF